jgi:hypothetical protein
MRDRDCSQYSQRSIETSELRSAQCDPQNLVTIHYVLMHLILWLIEMQTAHAIRASALLNYVYIVTGRAESDL